MKKILTISEIDQDPSYLYGREFTALDENGEECQYTKHAAILQGHDFHKRKREGVTAQTVADAMGNARHCAPASWRLDSEAGHLFAECLLFEVPGRDGVKEVEAVSIAGVEIDPNTGAPHFIIEVLDEDGELRPYLDRVTGRPAGSKLEKRYPISINHLAPADSMAVGITALVCAKGERTVMRAEKGARTQAKVDRRAAKREGVAPADQVTACARYGQRADGEWFAEPVHSAGKATQGIEAQTFGTGPDAEAQAIAACDAIISLFAA
jgi:hypothetical protein